MPKRIVKRLKTRILVFPKPALLAGFVGILFCLAYLDYTTSRFIQLSLFYALTAALAGWTLGSGAVYLIVSISTVLAFASDYFADPTVPLGFDIANHGLRSILWTLLGLTLVSLRKRLDLLDDAYAKIRTDLDAGRNVQMAFLSRPIPEDSRANVAVSFRTARELGGDYYDLRVIDDKLRVLVADVSGKGASAALVTGLFGGIYSELSRRHQEPEKLLSILDKEISPSLLDGMFITAFLLVLDLETGHGVYASAGHDPQIFMRDQEVVELYPTGLPVGVMDGIEISAETLVLSPQDKLLLFTDGVLNVRTSKEERLTEDEFLDIVKQACGMPVAQIPQRVFDRLDAEGAFDDDALFLALSLNLTKKQV